MKPGALAMVVLLVVAALTVTVMVARSGPVPPNGQPAPERQPAPSDEGVAPTISPTGPHPKAVLSETEHSFGIMAVNQTRTHVFVIENRGEAPLKLVQGKHTCKCTLSKLANDEVPPGGKADIELSWQPKSVDPVFRQSATILTNDPENRQIPLVVTGEVAEVVVVNPSDSWSLGDIRDDVATEVQGTIHSKTLEAFNILGIEGTSEELEVAAVPFDEEQLKAHRAKSGYTLKVKVMPPKDIGPFARQFIVRTDIKPPRIDPGDKPPDPSGTPQSETSEESRFTLGVHGIRPGPIRILTDRSTVYHPQAMAVDLEDFPSSQGKKGRLILFVSGLGDTEFQAEIESDTPYLKVELVRDRDFNVADRQKYDLRFEIPPGALPIARQRRDSARVTLKTNHPTAPELKFRVEFVILKDG